MNEQLASMIARTEYTQKNTSTPLLEFDRRGDVYTPGWLEQGVSTLRHWVSSLVASDDSSAS
jgi:hypothetical protein